MENSPCELRCRITRKRVLEVLVRDLSTRPVTYELVGVDKAVDWPRKDIEKGLEIINKKIKKLHKIEIRKSKMTLLSYVRLRQIFLIAKCNLGEKSPLYRVSAYSL